MGATSAGSSHAAAAAARPATPTHTDLRNVTVLVVEDDPADRHLVASQLRAADLQPRIENAATLAEALGRLTDDEEPEVDLVLLDLGLPDCQGLETLSRLAPVTVDVPVIVLTSHDDAREVAVAALRRGAHDYLVKGSTRPDELGRSIRHAIERHHLQRRSSEQLLHQAALHQLEVATSTAADVPRFIAAAANAVQAGLNARRVSVRLFAGATGGAATATAVEGPFQDSMTSQDLSIDLTDDEVTTIDLTDASSAELGTLTVVLPVARKLTAAEERFLTTAAASIVTHAERIAQLMETEHQSVDEMRKVAALQDDFLRAVSHELRTPLAAIFGFTETLRDHGPDLDADKTHSMLERLHANAQRLALLLEDLLDVGRITAGVAAAPDLRPHDLASVVTDIVRLLPDHSHDIQLDLDEAIGAVEGPKVERIVHNLLGNALRHTPAGTSVRVMTRREEDAVVLVVEDDGPGIPSADRPRVFEPFMQGTAASSSASPGTGVGLSLVQQFVDLHGGTVTLDDSATGGARFTVRLPTD